MRASPSMKCASGAQLAAALVLRGSGGVWSKGMAGGEMRRDFRILGAVEKRRRGGETKSRWSQPERYGARRVGNIFNETMLCRESRARPARDQGDDAHP